MAKNQTSAQKRHKQSEVRRLHNKSIKTECKTYVKKFIEACNAKNQDLAKERYVIMQSALDSARQKGVLKRNAVSRKKSRMMALYNGTFAAK